MTTISLRVENGRSFGRGVRNAKRMGGTFDGATKTWSVSHDAWKSCCASDREGLRVIIASNEHESNCGARYDASAACECHDHN